MKKLFLSLLGLIIVYLLLRLAFTYFSNGHSINYKLKDNDKDIIIHEIATFTEKDNYYFEIEIGKNIFKFQVFYDFNKAKKIIKTLKYYEDDNIKCILPIYEDSIIISDLLCLEDNEYNYYHNINYDSKSFGSFLREIRELGYDETKYQDNKRTNIYNKDHLTIYKDNLIDNHIIGLSNYKGLDVIKKDEKPFAFKLYNTDIYSNKVSIFKDNYYLSAAYDKVNGFSQIYVVNYVANVKKVLKMPSVLSYESYFQGFHGNNVYLIDLENKIQYEINLDNYEVNIVGNAQKGIIYYDNNQKKIVNYTNNIASISFLEENRKPKYGYVYTFEKENDSYKVFRANIQDENSKVFIFETANIDRIKYMDEYIYFISGNFLNYYSDYTGKKTVLINNEFKYNDTIIFNIYEK